MALTAMRAFINVRALLVFSDSEYSGLTSFRVEDVRFADKTQHLWRPLTGSLLAVPCVSQTDSRLSKSASAPAKASTSTPAVTATATVTPLTPQGERRATRPKSQLPVPSSRGPQRAPSTPRAVSSSSVSSHPHGQSAASPRPPGKAHTSSRARQALPTTNNPPTNHNNNNNSLSQSSHEEIWILHPNLHENYNNQG